jgi:hypothetical protein
MPQLVKGGKNAYGWSEVSNDGRIAIPPEAFKEYQFAENERAILMSGSKKSGGFGLTTLEKLKSSSISGILDACPELTEYKIPEGEIVSFNSRFYCWVTIRKMGIVVPLDTLKIYNISKGDLILSVRGSSLALGFIVHGPIIEEAKRHSILEVYE